MEDIVVVSLRRISGPLFYRNGLEIHLKFMTNFVQIEWMERLFFVDLRWISGSFLNEVGIHFELINCFSRCGLQYLRVCDLPDQLLMLIRNVIN